MSIISSSIFWRPQAVEWHPRQASRAKLILLVKMSFSVKKTGGRMWHEARKQEKKIRGMLVDYRRRAERRRDYYEKIVRSRKMYTFHVKQVALYNLRSKKKKKNQRIKLFLRKSLSTIYINFQYSKIVCQIFFLYVPDFLTPLFLYV